jgi:hypothetical protein
METQNEQKLDRYVSRNGQLVIKTIAGLGIFYTAVLVPLQALRADIDYIKNNHLAHIEQAITEIRQEEEGESDKNADRDKQLAKIVQMLEDHEKYTAQTIKP